MKHTTIIGGINTPNKSLEPLAEEVIKTGRSDDIEIFSFREAMEDIDRLKTATDKSPLITHSAGILAVKSELKPESITTLAGPEPRRVGQLLLSALRLTGNLQLKAITGPKRAEHAKLNLDKTLELVLHPIGNLKHLQAISRFSTMDTLSRAKDSGILVAPFAMSQDEFFPIQIVTNIYHRIFTQSEGVNPELKTIEGGHDHAVITPEDFSEHLS